MTNGTNSLSIMPCAFSAAVINRSIHNERNRPSPSNSSAGKQASMLAAIRALRSALGLTAPSTCRNAACKEADTNGQANRPRRQRDRSNLPKALRAFRQMDCPFPQVLGEIPGPLRVGRELRQPARPGQMAHQQIGPTFGAAAEAVQLGRGRGVDARTACQGHQRRCRASTCPNSTLRASGSASSLPRRRS